MRKFYLFGFLLHFAFLGLAQSGQSLILPKPAKMMLSEGTFFMPVSSAIFAKGENATVQYLIESVKTRFGISLKRINKEQNASIVLVNTKEDKQSEGYTLQVSQSQITISAKGEAGLFYGVQSLLQLMRAGKNSDGIRITEQTIEDAPRFHWRAFMLDESRHFKGEAEVIRLLDVMAELKMNIFHWHLTDDQGWRIEIKKYPLLTRIGSKRNDTQVGGWGSEKRAGIPHEGFYTQKQIKRIVRYAKARHIKIVPEIEMPGHASAAIAAYPWLGSSDEKIEVPATFGKHYAVFNVIDPKVQTFLKDVVSEVIPLFETDVIHIGGDEVRFNQWEANPAIKKYKEDKGFTSFMDIQIEFTNEMSRFIAKKGASMMGWNEILGKNLHADDKIMFTDPSQKIASNVIVHFWKGDLKEMAQAAKDGYRLVNSYHALTYLDYDYSTIPLKKAYMYNPIPDGLPLEYVPNIYGIGCQMWSEWIPTVDGMNRQVYPRIAAYAEVGWSSGEKDYDSFLLRLRPIAQGWTERGISFPLEEIK